MASELRVLSGLSCCISADFQTACMLTVASCSSTHVCGGLNLIRQSDDVHIKPFLNLVQDHRILLRGHKGDGQPLGAKSPSSAHLHNAQCQAPA